MVHPYFTRKLFIRPSKSILTKIFGTVQKVIYESHIWYMKVIYDISNFHFSLSSLKGSIIFKDGNQLFLLLPSNGRTVVMLSESIWRHNRVIYAPSLQTSWTEKSLEQTCKNTVPRFWPHNRQLELVETFSWDNSDNLLISFKTWRKKASWQTILFFIEIFVSQLMIFYLTWIISPVSHPLIRIDTHPIVPIILPFWC